MKGRNYEFKAEGAKYHLESRSKSQALVRFSFKTMGAIYPLEPWLRITRASLRLLSSKTVGALHKLHPI